MKTVKKEAKPTEKLYVQEEHAQVYKTLQHFGFAAVHKPTTTNLEEKLVDKKTELRFIADSLSIQRGVLDKSFYSFNFPVHLGYSVDKDTYRYHIVGTKKNIYDALAIEAGYSILQEILGTRKEILVEINYIGDKESVQRFTKELQNFFKKNVTVVPKPILTVAKKDIIGAYKMLKGVDIKPKTPKKGAEPEPVVVPNPIDHLSEESRKEFKEILEYIESLDMNFQIQPFLFESPDVVSGVIFNIHEIDESGKGTLSVVGVRNDILGKKLLNKKEVPTISVEVRGLKKIAKPTRVIRITTHTEVKFFYAQLGPEARFKTLKVIDMMRCAKIPVHHAISKEKISAQLAHAEKLNVPYLLLVGHREALQNQVTVRNMKNLSQESVELVNLIDYLKKLL